MRKLLRKWLGIEEDRDFALMQIGLLIRAINETFELDKKDKHIGRKMAFISIREFDKGGKDENN